MGFACNAAPGDPFDGEEHVSPNAETDPELIDVASKVQASAPMVRNLSNREYLNAISDLIGERLPAELQQAWTETTQFGGFDAVPWANFDTKAIRDRAETLDAILDRAVDSPKVMTCSAATEADLAYPSCAKRIVEPIAARAFGRPLADAEVQALTKAYDAAVTLAKTELTAPAEIFHDGLRGALGSVFLAPQFLTRSEVPPSPDFTGERDLTPYELANRVSFMFLGSLPDDALWARAQDGSLADPAVLIAEVERLIDARTDVFVQGFMGQWFDFRAYDSTEPASLERAMWNESWRVFADVVKQDLPLKSLVAPGYTYVNDQLAEHYGLSGTFSAEFQKVPTEARGGALQQASWLSLSATPQKTSPMHRGRLVQDRLLCKVIPPPDSALFEEIQAVAAGIPADATVKERLMAHREAAPACKACHQYMDPIGLGLEGFDQFGKLRTVYDDGKPVEAASDILGKPFATVEELNATLTGLPEYTRCVSEKLSVFSLRTSAPERPLLDYLTHPRAGKVPGLREMILRVVKSNAFRRVNHGAKI